MKKLLISGLGGSLFPYLHHRLRDCYEVVYIDANADLKRLYPDLTFIPAPMVLDPSYPQFIKGIVKSHHIDYYIPLIDEELPIAHSLIGDRDFECEIIAPQASFVQLTLNKLDLMRRLSEYGISSIPTWRGDDRPANMSKLIVKPISGRGSRGVRRINSSEEFDAYIVLENYDYSSVLLQSYYEGVEYTVGVLASADNRLLAISTRKVITKKGVTIQAITVNEPIIDQLVEKIQSMFKPSGPYNVQLIVDRTGIARVFEINPRFSTTLVMSYAGGIDEIGLFINSQSGDGTIQRPAEGIELFRTWQNNFIEAR